MQILHKLYLWIARILIMPRVFFKMVMFMKLYAFGKCSGITFVIGTMITVFHNIRRYFNNVFSDFAKNGKGTMGRCHGFKLHLICNDSGEVITSCLTGINVDAGDERVWSVFTKELCGKVFADRRYIKQGLFYTLFDQGVYLVNGLKANMKKKLMPMWNKIMLREIYIIECIK